MHSSTTAGSIDSLTGRKFRRLRGAPLAIALFSAALLASCGESVNAPRAVVGPEALTLDLVVSPTGVRTTQTVTFRATARNQGNNVIVARYAAPACGLRSG